MQISRSILLLIDTALFFFSLKFISLMEATAIFFCVPILVVIFSIPILKEQVGWRSIIAILIGFIGMIIIIRPGSNIIAFGALLTFGAAICAALFNITTRKLTNEDPLAVTMIYTAFVGAVILSIITPFVWQNPVIWLYGKIQLSGKNGWH